MATNGFDFSRAWQEQTAPPPPPPSSSKRRNDNIWEQHTLASEIQQSLPFGTRIESADVDAKDFDELFTLVAGQDPEDLIKEGMDNETNDD